MMLSLIAEQELSTTKLLIVKGTYLEPESIVNILNIYQGDTNCSSVNTSASIDMMISLITEQEF